MDEETTDCGESAFEVVVEEGNDFESLHQPCFSVSLAPTHLWLHFTPLHFTWEKIKRVITKYFCYGQFISAAIVINPPEPADSLDVNPHSINNKEQAEDDEEEQDESIENPPEPPSFIQRTIQSFTQQYLTKRPHWVGSFLPFIIIASIWSTFMILSDSWFRFTVSEEGIPAYQVSLVIIFASTIAGITSEGGGAISFPILTLGLGLSATIARDFSFMIQSVGMSGAAFNVVYSRLVISKPTVIFASIGGSIGLVTGLAVISPRISEDDIKCIFVSVWLAFAATLFCLNRIKNRKTYRMLPENMHRAKKYGVLVVVGIVGGVLMSLVGSGLDICSFAVLTLFFRVSEKVAVPTSVVLVAIQSCVGFFLRAWVFNDVDEGTWDYWICSIPFAVLCAPIGAFLSSYLHRQVLASLIYVIDVSQFLMAIIILDMTTILILVTIASFIIGISGFVTLAALGRSAKSEQSPPQQQEFFKLLCCLVVPIHAEKQNTPV